MQTYFRSTASFLLEVTGITIIALVCSQLGFAVAFFVLFVLKYRGQFERWLSSDGQIGIFSFKVEKSNPIRMLVALIVCTMLGLLLHIMFQVQNALGLR
jgi:hypothetical protein